MLKVLEKILTIIIPVYNQERYLDECLENIAMENNEKIEIILINDGSVDNSIKIMKKYAKKNNKIRIISIQNRGCSFVRNLGITLATGKYIWFIDSDDFIEKNSIKLIIKKLESFDKELLVFGYTIIKNGKKIKKVYPQDYNVSLKNFYKYPEIYNSSCNKIYKTDIIKKNSIFFLENCHMGEDLFFNYIYMNYTNEIEFYNTVLYNCRQGVGITANSDFEKRLEIFKVFSKFVEKKLYEKDKRKIDYLYRKFCIKIPYYIIYQLDKNKRKENILKLKEKINESSTYYKKNYYIFQLLCQIEILIKKSLKKYLNKK